MSQLEREPGHSEAESWAVLELGGAQLGDLRRSQRLVTLATALAKHPDTSLPAACGSWTATKAAYRFLDNDAVEPDDILAAHRDSTLKRIAAYPMVLAVQDTTVYNFTTHRATRGLGPITRKTPGYNEPGAGFFVHSCLAVSPEGVPLGLLGQHLWVRPEPDGRAKRNQRRSRPTEDKESARWLNMLATSTEALPPTTRVVTVADREADIFDFFLEAVELQRDLLVRAAWDRRLREPDGYLWDAAEQAEVVGTLTITVPRADDRPSRTANLELRTARVQLRPPHKRSSKVLPPVVLSAVLAREANPPTGQAPIEWLLLTTQLVSSVAEASDCVRWYTHRWKIERYHYTLKSGCQVEELELEDIERLHRALAVYAVVAWRLLYLTYMARVEPQAPCTVVLSSSEWQALYCTIHRKKRAPQTPPDLQTAVLWIARLGGFLARKRDGAPGVKVLWQGYRRLQDLTAMWEIFNDQN